MCLSVCELVCVTETGKERKLGKRESWTLTCFLHVCVFAIRGVSIGCVRLYVIEGELCVCVCVRVCFGMCVCVCMCYCCVWTILFLCTSVSVLLVLGVTSTEVLGNFSYSHAHIAARQCL